MLIALAGCTRAEVAWLENTPLAFVVPEGAPPATDTETADSDFSAGEPDFLASTDGSASAEERKEAAAEPRPGSQVAKAVPAPRARPATPRPEGGGEASVDRELRPAIAHPPTRQTPGRHLPSPSSLVGLDEKEVVRMLGQPERVQSKPPATVWSYTADDCELDVFFYLDLASERFRVLAYEVNAVRGSQEMKKVCLGRIQSARRAN